MPLPAQPRGCKGRSPLHMKSKNLPLPRRGRGAGGWGQETKLKAGQAGNNKEGKPPLRIPERQGQPATSRASRPCGHHSGKVSRQPAGQAAQRAPTPQVQPVPPPAQARGCKGRSPLHKITLKLPLPRRGRGAGGWGKEIKLKAGQAGDNEGKPPLRIPERQGQPATSRASRPAGTCLAGAVSAASGLMQGCRGQSPRRNKVKISPFPTGEGGRGDRGQESKPKAG